MTSSFHYVCGIIVALSVFAPALHSEPIRESFTPNYVAIEDVSLSSPNGNERGRLVKGTLVAAREMGNVLDVKTRSGEFGLANRRSFRRLSKTIKITDEARSLAASLNRFAFDAYRQLRLSDGNLFVSPASVWTALAMACDGAAGSTRDEMEAVLHLDSDRDAYRGVATLMTILNSVGEENGYSLTTANRLWGAANCSFEPPFIQRTRDSFGAGFESLDFSNPEAARQIVNRWIANETQQRITGLISSGGLDRDSRLVLTNAIAFQGGWSIPFSKNATKTAPFRINARDKSDVMMMRETAHFPYTEDDHTQVVELPYRGHELSMVIALPKSADGLEELESVLTSQSFGRWVDQLRAGRPVDVYLPKFSLRANVQFSNTLRSLGMASAFRAEANFAGISRDQAMCISEVVHQACVEVDEEGTEAAAATVVTFAPTAELQQRVEPPHPVVFRADHPFIFAIYDHRTDAVLFVARFQRPGD